MALQYHSPLEGESARGRSPRPQSSRRGAAAPQSSRPVEPEGEPAAAPRRAGGGQTPRPVEPVGGQTPRPVTEYQRHGLRSLGGGVRALEGFRQVS